MAADDLQAPEWERGGSVETELDRAASDLRATLERATVLPASQRAAAVHDKVRRFQEVAGLATDGVYGPATRAALARALGVPVGELPPTIPRASSSRGTQAPADSETVPAWLPVAAALARWTEDARASDSTASAKLRALAPHAASIVPLTQSSMRGIEVGAVPTAPTSQDGETWAAQAWARARAEGASARASLSSHARAITTAAERALVDVRRALDRETDSAVRGALEMVERGLVSILRPLSTAIREGIAPIVAPIGPGLALAALAALVFMSGGSRRR